MRARDFRKMATEKCQFNQTNLLVIFLIVLIIASAIQATTIVGLILMGPLTMGVIKVITKVYNGEKADLQDVFYTLNETGLRTFGKSVEANLLITLFTFLWSLLFVIPGIIKSYSYAMTFYIIDENPDIAVEEAIDESKRIMHGNKWRLFCLDLSYIGWIFLCILTFGILYLWITPKMELARYLFYKNLKGEIQ
jgi:uncharacterized membrane protein